MTENSSTEAARHVLLDENRVLSLQGKDRQRQRARGSELSPTLQSYNNTSDLLVPASDPGAVCLHPTQEPQPTNPQPSPKDMPRFPPIPVRSKIPMEGPSWRWWSCLRPGGGRGVKELPTLGIHGDGQGWRYTTMVREGGRRKLGTGACRQAGQDAGTKDMGPRWANTERGRA